MQQRQAFISGIPPPDFPGGDGESKFMDKATVEDVQSDAGQVAMGLRPIPVDASGGTQTDLAREVNSIFGH